MSENFWIPDFIEDWRLLLGSVKTIITILDHQFTVLNQFNAEDSPLAATISQHFADHFSGTTRSLLLNALQQVLISGETSVLEPQLQQTFSACFVPDFFDMASGLTTRRSED